MTEGPLFAAGVAVSLAAGVAAGRSLAVRLLPDNDQAVLLPEAFQVPFQVRRSEVL